ncbi:MAG: NAD-glutamate dehydrogenase [Gammaproteobacteria bacterium]|nr:MAG: NAD-glutamate dehydrogenase [Gammaproteobacteria bacterium]
MLAVPKKPHRRASDVSSRLIDDIVASKPASKSLKSKKEIDRFLRRYYSHVPFEDLQNRSPIILGQAAVSHLEFAKVRKNGKPLLRIFNPTEDKHGYQSAFTIVEVVNDNMPFLVDSVSAAITGQDLSIHMTVHPLLRVHRDKRGKLTRLASMNDEGGTVESYIRLAIDRDSDLKHLKVLEHQIQKVLADIRVAVRDWRKMRDKMLEAAASLHRGPVGADPALRVETDALLQWMAGDHFTFLGYREYKLRKRGESLYLAPVKGSGLGVLTNDERGGRAIELSKEMRRITRTRDWLIITKANSRSTVHRHSYLDYVGVKIYDDNGNAVGEKRFIGLFTSIAYSENPRNIPLLRLKVQRVLEQAEIDPAGHRGKALSHILDSYPRDELFQSSVHDLVRTTIGILNLQDRTRVKFFLRRDTFRRFFSCIVYVPREKYTTAIRRRVEEILLEEFQGISVESSVQIIDSPLARLHSIVRTGHDERPRISIRRIEERIADAVVTWRDHLRTQLVDRFGQDEGLALFREYGESFPPAYEDDTLPRTACLDVKRIDGLLKGEHEDFLLLHQPAGTAPDRLHFLSFQKDEPLPLSKVLPILEDLGTDVHSEHPYELTLRNGDSFWVQDFQLQCDIAADLDLETAAERFQEGFRQALSGESESDNFNELILAAGLDSRQTSLIRCYAKYILQLGIPFSQNSMEEVLVAHSNLACMLVKQFEFQFDPKLSKKTRTERLNACTAKITRAVARAKSLDEDRILSAFAGAVSSTLRTNYFQTGEDGKPKSYISIKLDPGKLPEVPLPKPKYEIFVYSPRVEGVHLRGGDIARGGIRWSDRREDFRTEVLGLMKAQVVKNTVIVPTGAKGGFIPKRMPGGDREAVMAEGIACYQIFISGLLDITDNVVGDKVVTPANVIRRDRDDPYLVVAADKGTATFSDIANSISTEYGFWLDDAFASGGSVGYDHKKMGITARGAWEAVKRHFREQGVNVQTDPFTVAAIGDMSGDVFGNGMLLSRKIRLVAAFNHMHIFLDPDPDLAGSFRERQRLFRMDRSSWADYKDNLISKGGGIYSRHAKQIKLSVEVRQMLGTIESSMQPLELIRAILRMQVDLLWNGGIGTYVKASTESDAEVGDKSNDSVRVNANELRCKVIGEGGNLGLTQRARVEYSLNGGRVNTDFIDNSAGVDCSDREVNIKILLSVAEQEGRLTRKRRNVVLAEMTDDVAAFVLRSNYLQTQSISMMEARARERLDETARLITNLEKTGLLDRDLEFLPDEVEIDERRQRKQGLTRPELAVVLSYAKIDLYDGLVSSTQELDDFLTTDPQRYFPPLLRRRYLDLIPGHRLSRQILATLIANNIVNRMGPAFVKRVQVDTGADVMTIARAYVVAREVCQCSDIWHTIESLDNEIPATLQQSMMFEVSRILRHACYWLIERYGDDLDIVDAVEQLKKGMATIYSRATSIVAGPARARQKSAAQEHMREGVPEKLAKQMAALLLTRGGLDISDMANLHKKSVTDTARMYSAMSDRLGIVWMNRCVESLEVEGRWQALARSNLRDDFYRIRRDFVTNLLGGRGRRKPVEVFDRWCEKNVTSIRKYDSILAEMRLRHEIDFATLSVAAQELRKLTDN